MSRSAYWVDGGVITGGAASCGAAGAGAACVGAWAEDGGAVIGAGGGGLAAFGEVAEASAPLSSAAAAARCSAARREARSSARASCTSLAGGCTGVIDGSGVAWASGAGAGAATGAGMGAGVAAAVEACSVVALVVVMSEELCWLATTAKAAPQTATTASGTPTYQPRFFDCRGVERRARIGLPTSGASLLSSGGSISKFSVGWRSTIGTVSIVAIEKKTALDRLSSVELEDDTWKPTAGVGPWTL